MAPTKTGKRARSPSSPTSTTMMMMLSNPPSQVAMAFMAFLSLVNSSQASHSVETAFVGLKSSALVTQSPSLTSLCAIKLSPQDKLPEIISDNNNNNNIHHSNNNNDLFTIFQEPPTQSILRPLNAKTTEKKALEKNVATFFTTIFMSLAFLTNPLLPHLPFSPTLSMANAEDELYAKYGNKGFDTSLVDQHCLVDHCSLQAKACLQDDPDCRKGLTCTAKCLGDNSCITGCFARYGTPNLDNLLKCTIEDHECIKVAILEGGGDAYGQEPKSPAPTISKFDLSSMEGTWYKVAGYNPNYDCYACQRNTFSAPEGGWLDQLQIPAGGLLGNYLPNVGADTLEVDVEFSMPRLLPDGSPPPPSGVRESMESGGLMSVGYNAYSTHEKMVFDSVHESSSSGILNGKEIGDAWETLVLGKDAAGKDKVYSRTAHSEGEMFGLKFWENWYVIGQNDPGQDEFKFIYYNGKTRQNTYDGAFVYSRTRNLSPSSMEKVYQIAKDAGMNPDQFCKIQNSCFEGDDNNSINNLAPREREGLGSPSNPFRGILASTKVSQFLGVESVAAESNIPRSTISSDFLNRPASSSSLSESKERPWWKEVGDYLEDPRRHFRLMDSLRVDMDWPDYIKERNNI